MHCRPIIHIPQTILQLLIVTGAESISAEDINRKLSDMQFLEEAWEGNAPPLQFCSFVPPQFFCPPRFSLLPTCPIPLKSEDFTP